jgi:hypothetical protein
MADDSPAESEGLQLVRQKIADRVLIRSLAKRLAQDDPEASRIRSEVMRSVSDMPKKGGILAALRRSPLVGADLKIERSIEAGRKG